MRSQRPVGPQLVTSRWVEDRLAGLGIETVGGDSSAEAEQEHGLLASEVARLQEAFEALRAGLPEPGWERAPVLLPPAAELPGAACDQAQGVAAASVQTPDGLRALALRLARGELSPVEAVAETLAQVKAIDDRIGAFVSIDGDRALAEAAALAELPRESRGALWGVPLAVKDVIDVAGMATEACSPIRRGHRAGRDAEAVAALRRAGAVIVGKLNTHEFAYGSTTTSPHRPPSRNPWDPMRICGGSSGGSAAAVAAGMLTGALGTDTAGSVRVPATLCGVCGLRPTYGRVSLGGVFPVASCFDTVGPLARDARDCALLLAAIEDLAGTRASSDWGSGTLAPLDPHRLPDMHGVRVGLVEPLLGHTDLQPGIAEAAGRAASLLADAGARLLSVKPTWLADAAVAQQAIQYPQAAEVHLDWLRARPGDYGQDVRLRLLCGLLVAPTAQATGERALRWLRACVRSDFERVDLLLAPSLPMTAPPIARESYFVDGRELPYRPGIVAFNSPWSALGLPALAVPSGQIEGLPVGVQLVGPPGADGLVLGAGAAIQDRSNWHLLRPPLAPMAPGSSVGS
jgi:aspartyl-tRNA(Asn)/glutamyl-tRNA(Gln) amidotransferase subunit A